MYCVELNLFQRLFKNRISLITLVSSSLNFSVVDFLHRTRKITAVQNIKSCDHQNQTYQLRLSKHHTHRINEYLTILSNHNLNVVEIEKIVLEACQHARSLLLELDINILLGKYKIDNIKSIKH